MNLSISKLKELFFFWKYLNLKNTQKLCYITGFSNIFTCFLFFLWVFTTKNNSNELHVFTVIASLIFIFHIYLNLVLINWSLGYEETKLSMWSWLSLVFVFPFGLGLIFFTHKNENWNKGTEKRSIFHSLTNSLIYVSDNLNTALKYLNENHKGEMKEFFRLTQLPEDTELWPNKAKFVVMALYQALKKNRKKNTFEDIVFNAHWYDSRRFDFAVLDPKGKIMPVKHKYSIAFLVLDEVNNYQKILNFKKEIKANIKFSTAKTICLHWGKGFKFYVNV